MAVEGGPIAQAAAELVLDFSRFPNDVKVKLRTAASTAGRDFNRELNRATSRTGREVGDRVGRDAGRGGAQAGNAWGRFFHQALAGRIAGVPLARIFAPLALIAKSLAFSAIGGGAAAAAVGLLQFAVAAGQAAGVVFALPSALAVGAAALLTLAVATHGVGDAFAAALSGDPKKLAEALEKLSPAARAVVGEFKDLVPQLNNVKNATQDAFFSQLHGQLTAIAAVLLGPVSTGMVSVAGSSALVALGVAEIARQTATVQLVAGAFDVAAGSVDNLRPGLLAIVTGFRDLGLIALPILLQLSAGAGEVAQDFGEWLQTVAASGQAFNWIQTALATLRQLGDLLLQIGGIVGAVFRAAQASSGGLLGTFTDLARSVNAFLSSAEGQDALLSVFRALQQVGGALSPVITALATALGTQIAPQIAKIAVALGPGLTGAINALGPALGALGPGLTAVAEGLSQAFSDPEMAEGLRELGRALSDTLIALTPLLPPLGRLVVLLATVLSRNLTTAAPLFELLARVIAAVVDPIIDLADWVNRLANQFSRWLYFDQIGGALLGVGNAAASVARFFVDLWNAIRNIDLSGVAASIGSFVAGVGRWFANLPAVVGSGLVAFGAFVLAFFASLPARIASGLASLGQFLWSAFTSALNLGLQAIGAGIGLIILAVTQLPGLLVQALFGLGQIIYDALLAAWQLASAATVAGIESVVAFAVSLPSRIVAGLAALGSMLAQWATSAWAGAVNATTAGIAFLVSFVASLPGRAIAALAALGGMLNGFFSSVWSSAVGTVQAGINWVVSTIASLPGRILAFGGAMLSAGTSLMNSFWNGLKNFVGGAADLSGRIVAAVRQALNYVISRLNAGIASVWPGALGAPPRIPGLADGAIVTQTTIAMIGEAGTEVVIPLTRPARAVQLAADSGLISLLARQGALPRQDQAPTQVVTINAPITVEAPYSDPELVAESTVDRLMRAAAV